MHTSPVGPGYKLANPDPQTCLQGLEVCSAGRALSRPHRLELEQWVEEQVGWAASSETTSAQYLEAFAFRRGKAIEGAGVLLLGSNVCSA